MDESELSLGVGVSSVLGDYLRACKGTSSSAFFIFHMLLVKVAGCALFPPFTSYLLGLSYLCMD